jgi:hypothetical protein
MLEFYAEHRGLINSLLVFAFACFIPFNTISVIRKQRACVPATPPVEGPVPQHPIITALNEAGAIGVGIVWATLIYSGPSLTQLWRGEGRISHWWAVLLCTQFWLTFSRVIVPQNRVHVATAIIVRVLVYGGFFVGTLVVLNDW